MNEDNNEQKIYFINTIAKFCDKCGTKYTPDNLEIIQESVVSSIIHFSCQKCKASHIATYIKPLGMSHRVAVNSDLDSTEFSKFQRNGETSPDEILEIYTYLKENQKVTI
jgi:hypothetical protein